MNGSLFYKLNYASYLVAKYKQQEALRERRPPWARQIITPILPTVKMLSLGGERLTPQKNKNFKN